MDLFCLCCQRTGEKIALKEMRTDTLRDLQPSEREKTKMRLINEIKIMWEHNHENLIKALCQPEVCPDGRCGW